MAQPFLKSIILPGAQVPSCHSAATCPLPKSVMESAESVQPFISVPMAWSTVKLMPVGCGAPVMMTDDGVELRIMLDRAPRVMGPRAMPCRGTQLFDA